MESFDDELTQDHSQIRRAGLPVIAFFWLLQFLELTGVSLAEGGTKALLLMEPRAIVLCMGLLLTMAVAEVAARSAREKFRVRLVRAFSAATVTCAVLVTFNYAVFDYGFRADHGEPFDPVDFTYTAFMWSWFFYSVAAALLALQYSFDVRARDTQVASLRGIAADAQLAALRYQLNPHFLFNTLNSVAALISEGEPPAAELMVENLADFLRATLDSNPDDDITLSQELGLQKLYLSIERVRFPERLRMRCQIDADVTEALVPSLLTQPIVENGVRHSVARSNDPVTLSMSACRSGERLRIMLEENGRPCGKAVKQGMGLGIKNIRARLRARFADNQSLISGPLEAGGYRTVIELPLSFRE